VAHRVWLVIGSDDAEPDGQGGNRFFNSAFLISPGGQILDRYSKRHLVMFGEYVPLSRWLPFLKKLTPVGDGFTPGTAPGHFNWFLGEDRAVPVRMAMLICFEDVMPGLVRRSVAPDSDFILNLTNDGWFRESAAQWQHAANAVFRAVENGRPLVRCTNNGRTIWVDAAGRIRELESHPEGGREDIYAEGWHIARVPLAGGGDTASSPTFYARNGDWFGWACVALAGALLPGRLRMRWGKNSKGQ
jgi:apolipoprotein N-acyltransferase